MATQPSILTASNLKEALWSTLNQVKAKKMLPGHADAIASQAFLESEKAYFAYLEQLQGKRVQP